MSSWHFCMYFCFITFGGYIEIEKKIKSADTIKFAFKLSHWLSYVSWGEDWTHCCTFNLVIKLIIAFLIIVF